jgi:hypothetical protein
MHIFMHAIKLIEFTCIHTKNDTNMRERGLPLLAARVMFNAAILVREDTRKAYPNGVLLGTTPLTGA